MKSKTKTYSFDGLPHKFPQLRKEDAYEDILAWECQACGEWIKEYKSEKRTECTIDWRDLKMNERQKVMKEPPIGSVVIAKNGSAWQKDPKGWGMVGSDGSWKYSWATLVNELYEEMDYPTQEWASVLGDPRLPLIVYVPHEELITDEDEE